MKRALIAVVALAFAAGCSEESSIKASPVPPHVVVATPELINFHSEMNKLMSEHVIWTRSYLKGVISDTGDEKAAVARLSKNQDDLGAVFTRYYGIEAGLQMTRLLKEHMNITAEIILSVKARQSKRHEEINRKWQLNGYEITDYMVSLNPNWEKLAMREMWDKHLATTTAEIVARAQKDWGADVIAFDETYHHMLMLGDMIVEGIVAQFPKQFKQ